MLKTKLFGHPNTICIRTLFFLIDKNPLFLLLYSIAIMFKSVTCCFPSSLLSGVDNIPLLSL